MQLKMRKEAVRHLIAACQEKLPGTNYDRFFVEEFAKKLRTIEIIESVVQRMRDSSPETARHVIEEIVRTKGVEADGQLTKLRKQEAEAQAKKVEEIKKANEWSHEEIARLTKAIAKFAGGIPNRWKVITDFVGDRTQKEVITKAQEIAERQKKAREEKDKSEGGDSTPTAAKNVEETKVLANEKRAAEDKSAPSWSVE